MIPYLYVMPQPPLVLVVGGVYLAIGTVAGAVLARKGLPVTTCVGAVLGWPLLAAVLDTAPDVRRGPMSERIDESFRLLDTALADPSSHGLALGDDLRGLRESLGRADGRLILVDRLIADEPAVADAEVRASFASLRDARAHAVTEIEGVLSGLVRLRVQIGMLALAGDATPIRERLRELGARVRALEEVSAFARADTSTSSSG
jgi:hypothetical protein